MDYYLVYKIVNWMHVTLAVVFVIVFYEFLRSRWRFQYLGNKLPGPIALPLIGNAMHFLGSSSHEMLDKISNLTKIYGSPMRFWLGPELNVVISDPENIQSILMSSKALMKGPTYKFMQIYVGDGLLAGSGEKWKIQRKVIGPSFSAKQLKISTQIFKKHCDLLVVKLEQTANGDVFNIFDKIALCTFDIVCGRKKVDGLCVVFIFCLVCANSLAIITQGQFMNFMSETELSLLKKCGHLLLTRIFKNKVDVGKQQNGVMALDTILEIQKLTMHDKKDAAFTLFTASQESTATLCSFLFLMLAIHQNIQKTVHAEINSIFENKSGEITIEDLSKLTYLDLCIKETLRLFPIGTVLQRQLKEEIQLNSGVKLPKGCSVALLIYVMHRDPTIWKNPDRFIPERFTAEESRHRPPFAYIPFSMGPMNCIGQRYAELVIKSIAAYVLRGYRVECNYQSMDDVKLKTDISVRPTDGYPIKLYKRKFETNITPT